MVEAYEDPEITRLDMRFPDLPEGFEGFRIVQLSDLHAGSFLGEGDLADVVGEAPELKNYFVAAGLNSIGILTGGGLGRVMAHWIMTGLPDVDVTAMNINRVLPYQANPDYRRARTVESLGMVYKCHYPTHTLKTARGVRGASVAVADVGWGAWAIETGWTQAWITSVLALRQMRTSFWSGRWRGPNG